MGVEAEVEAEAEAEVVERARFTAAEEDEKGDLVESCAGGYGHVILGFYGGCRLGFVGWLVAPMCVCVCRIWEVSRATGLLVSCSCSGPKMVMEGKSKKMVIWGFCIILSAGLITCNVLCWQYHGTATPFVMCVWTYRLGGFSKHGGLSGFSTWVLRARESDWFPIDVSVMETRIWHAG